MRILVLVPDAFGGRGGIAQYNRDFLNSLCTYHDITEVVAIPRKIVDCPDSLPEKLTYVTAGAGGKLNYIGATLQAVKLNPKFDLIVCGHINLLPIAYLMNMWAKSPIFLVLYGTDAWQPSPSWLSNNLVNKIDGVISISEFTKKRFLDWTKLYNTQDFILPCTVNLKNYQPKEKNFELVKRYKLEGKTVLMTLGRLDSGDRYKGFDEILELLPSVSQKIPNITYMIVGEGSDRERLEAKVESLRLNKHVVFTGFIPEAEKADYYQLADAFAMPGRGEGFGIVYLEAMACGVPVVASKADASSEAVRNGELGIIVNPDDPEEIEAGILEALKRPKGVVPEGLDYFSDDNFEQRCHQILQVLKR